MINTPISDSTIQEQCKKLGITNVGKSTIREVVGLVNSIEAATGEKFVRMEMGVPSLRPPQIGTDAEIKALNEGRAAIYPPVDGLPELKYESARFVKQFIGVDISPE
ncbi:MAG: pyridoxal phosphate-dependent aminotransferase, partial [Bacteroidales bacterium]|nr:pyridoxal phosphate-dependent aminotransferase [Bacteroidales bacterium]